MPYEKARTNQVAVNDLWQCLPQEDRESFVMGTMRNIKHNELRVPKGYPLHTYVRAHVRNANRLIDGGRRMASLKGSEINTLNTLALKIYLLSRVSQLQIEKIAKQAGHTLKRKKLNVREEGIHHY